MKKIISASLAFLMVCFFFTSCQKSGIEQETSIEPATKTSFLSSDENRVAVTNALKTYFGRNISASRVSSNGAKFIVPFFTGESQGVGRFDPSTFSLELASFSADYSGSDFYRRNPDGTISVHVNSKNAMAEYYANLFDPGALYLYGNRGHLAVTYTGEVVEIFPGFYIIDTENSGRAYSFHGNGKVGENGTAPWHNLLAMGVITPSGQAQVSFSLK
jgi:hypothetical protein